MMGLRQEKRLMVYAAYAEERDQLDLVVDHATEDAGGDMRTGILELVRRQHRSEAVILFPVAASKKRGGRRCA